jgi:hypothetical protein
MKILKNSKEWLILLAILAVFSVLTILITWFYVFYKEDDKYVFLVTIYVLPWICVFIFRKEFLHRILGISVAISYWFIFYYLFVYYMNHPWFVNNCDGPCFGTYSFENRPIYAILLLNGFYSSMLALAFDVLIKRIKFLSP